MGGRASKGKGKGKVVPAVADNADRGASHFYQAQEIGDENSVLHRRCGN